MERNIIEGISTLTTIDKNALSRLVDIGELVIIDEVVEQLVSGGSTANVNIGIGTLSIHCTGDSVKFKFVPNAKFEGDVADACIHKTNLLDAKVEASLQEKIVNTYKDLL